MSLHLREAIDLEELISLLSLELRYALYHDYVDIWIRLLCG